MSEETTFRYLRRLPFSEIRKQVEEAISEPHLGIPPLYRLGNITADRDSFYNPIISKHYQLSKTLEIGGWTLEEFINEMEKSSIIEQVKMFNENLEFPEEILKRGKIFFPKIKFIPAQIEFE